MPIATAPALLLGLGARILLDHFNRLEAPSGKDFILVGAWQGVALHYAIKTSGFGIIVAFGIAVKLFIEFNLVLDITRCVMTIVGITLGVLFTDFLSQYFDRPPHSSDRKRKKHHQSPPTPIKLEIKRDRLAQSRPSVQGGSVETLIDPTSNSFILSDITSIDSRSEALAPGPTLSPLEREIHALRTRASLADSERRRCKEERKWAVSQGNIARASQMKWEVKRYTALMQTFNREADLKAMEVSTNSHRQNNKEDQKQIASSSKEKATRSYRDIPNIKQTISNDLVQNAVALELLMDDEIDSVGNFNLPTSRDLHQLYILHDASRDLPLANLLPIQIYLHPVEQMAYSGWLEEARTSALRTNSSSNLQTIIHYSSCN